MRAISLYSTICALPLLCWPAAASINLPVDRRGSHAYPPSEGVQQERAPRIDKRFGSVFILDESATSTPAVGAATSLPEPPNPSSILAVFSSILSELSTAADATIIVSALSTPLTIGIPSVSHAQNATISSSESTGPSSSTPTATPTATPASNITSSDLGPSATITVPAPTGTGAGSGAGQMLVPMHWVPLAAGLVAVPYLLGL